MNVFSLVCTRFPVATQYNHHRYDYLGFSLHMLIGRDRAHLHNYEVSSLINSHILWLRGQLSHFNLAVYQLYKTSLFTVIR